jgi:hypothetical protein
MFSNEDVATKVFDGECNDLSAGAGDNELSVVAALVSLHATSKRLLANMKRDASSENLVFE